MDLVTSLVSLVDASSLGLSTSLHATRGLGIIHTAKNGLRASVEVLENLVQRVAMPVACARARPVRLKRMRTHTSILCTHVQ